VRVSTVYGTTNFAIDRYFFSRNVLGLSCRSDFLFDFRSIGALSR